MDLNKRILMKSKSIDWTKQFVELCIVFIGITMAFMLNNWREDYKSRQLEQKYLIGFHEDIVHDDTELGIVISANAKKMVRAKNTIAAIKAGHLTTDSALEIFGDMVQMHLFFSKANTYESIKNSGNLNIIVDYDLKEELISYNQSFESKKLQEDYYKLYISYYVVPFVYQNMDFLNQKIVHKNTIDDFAFHNLVLGYYQLLTQLLENYEDLNKKSSKLKLILNSELNTKS